MHDTLDYWSTDPYYRAWHHNQLTFGLTYAWAEHFVLPLSHDEVVHLKKSLLGKMPGSNDHERFANLRALYTWMWAHPGKQLLFMGGELADPHEWSHDRGLDWSLADQDRHAGVQRLVGDLNAIQAHHPVLHRGDGDPAGVRLAGGRRQRAQHLRLRAARPRHRRRGRSAWPTSRASTSRTTASACRRPGRWRGLITSDDARYVGSGRWVPHLEAEPVPWQDRPHSATITIPPLTCLYLIPERTGVPRPRRPRRRSSAGAPSLAPA